jgi:S-DNA-T family DNA segregation ATPase FtsK/SpoIIIE
VGYVRLEASPDPVRVRAAYVTDDDICAMAETIGYLPGGGL